MIAGAQLEPWQRKRLAEQELEQRPEDRLMPLPSDVPGLVAAIKRAAAIQRVRPHVDHLAYIMQAQALLLMAYGVSPTQLGIRDAWDSWRRGG